MENLFGLLLFRHVFLIPIMLPLLLKKFQSSIIEGCLFRLFGGELRKHDFFELGVLVELGLCFHGRAHVNLVVETRHRLER